MKPENIIEDIIWAYKRTLDTEKVKQLFVPIMETWAAGTVREPGGDSVMSDGELAHLIVSSEKLKEMRKQLGFTLKFVEKATGISNAYLSQLETGKIKKPSFDTVQKLNKFYNSYQ